LLLLRPSLWPVHPLEREIVFLIEPRALEVLEREVGPASEGQGIDRELDVRVLLFPGIRLVIEDLQITMRYTPTNLDSKKAAVAKLESFGGNLVTVCTKMQQSTTKLSPKSSLSAVASYT